MAGDPSAQHGADHAGGLLGGGLLACRHADEAAGLQTQLCGEGILLIPQELADAAGEIAVFVHLHPAGFIAGLDFYVCQKLIDPLSGLGEVVHRHSLDGRALKGTEAAALNLCGNVLDFQVDPQVGLVGAVALHGIVIRDANKGSLTDPPKLAKLLKHGLEHFLQGGQHVILGGKGHFHIQLVELAGGAIGPGILVPEAGGNLEIAVKAGGHQKLLKLLGGLGQGIELAGVVPGGHQVVPSALGRGGRQDGGGDLQEVLGRHPCPDIRHHLAAKHDIALHSGVAQIQEPVFESGILIGFFRFVDLEGQLVVDALAQHLDFFRHHFNFAGGQLGVFALPLPDGAGDGEGGFLVDGLDGLHHLFGLNDHLGGAVIVPQDAEGEIRAHFPDILQPAHNGDLLARVGKPQLAAVMCSGLHHR